MLQKTVAQKLEAGPMFEMAIVEHRFTPYLRDYDVLVDVSAPLPKPAFGSYIVARYRYRFTHCVYANVTTAISDHSWRTSWADVFTDYDAYIAAGEQEGYVWGVCWMMAYPGLTYIENSEAAREWTARLQKPMHEVLIETNAHNIRLLFHDVSIDLVMQADPDTQELVAL